MKTTRIATLFALVAMIFTAGCANTIRGAGQDVRNTADAVEDQF